MEEPSTWQSLKWVSPFRVVIVVEKLHGGPFRVVVIVEVRKCGRRPNDDGTVKGG